MESPRKFNDCYFYYYSTCTKGDNCVFRHEPSALGCETMCSAWQQGKCLDKRCKLRHMELRKNRKQIPCYWENQPGGCRKKHCPFMHKNPDARTDGIAPSQPAPHQPAGVVGVGVGGPGVGVEGVGVGVSVGVGAPCEAPAVPAPQPLPMLWQHQQQRQVVLDSAILGVLPSPELVRRGPHEPVYPLPVDPLVVNFEEESDNESAPSSTPTKRASPTERAERGAAHELALLERIQAEAAALYAYDAPVPVSLSIPVTMPVPVPVAAPLRTDLDFKVLSLDEIRARKKADVAPAPAPITLNLSRKRKLSTQETVTSAGNKIIKLVRSTSIVYKKVDRAAAAAPVDSRRGARPSDLDGRKRTLSDTSDLYDSQLEELVDDCHEFKRIRIASRQFTSKPRLIRNRPVSFERDTSVSESSKPNDSKTDNDSDSEVQIVSVGLADTTNVELSDSEIIDVESAKMAEPVDFVDLSDDDDVTITGGDLPPNVPDVVASCHKKTDTPDNLLNDIDSILNDTNMNSTLNDNNESCDEEL